MSDQTNPEVFHTVVVGGGIAGLYCSMKLAEKRVKAWEDKQKD